MRLGPGKQPATPLLSARRVLILLLLGLIAVWFWTTRYPPVREYRLYLFEERPDATLAWESLSHAWTEARVKEHFRGAPIRCLPDESGTPGIKRVCAVDLRRLNGVPTMSVNFLFSDVGLQRVATNIPLWSHRRGLDALVKAYGEPDAGQSRPVSGVRLLGWQLPGRSAVFYNRDPDFSPLMTNSTQWTGPTACNGGPCLR